MFDNDFGDAALAFTVQNDFSRINQRGIWRVNVLCNVVFDLDNSRRNF